MMYVQELLPAIGRVTLFTSASAAVAWLLLTKCRVDSPRVHRLAWLVVVIQGWLLFPWTWRIESLPSDRIAESVNFATLMESDKRGLSKMVVRVPVADDSATVARQNAAEFVISVWIVGTLAIGAMGVWRYAKFVRSLPPDTSRIDPQWQLEWQRQLRFARIRRRIELRMTDGQGPLLCFIPLRYLVVAPRALWTALTRPQRQVILRHELAHLERGDLWKSLAIRLLALPQWFNPLMWQAVRGFEEAGEWACDDIVARGRRSRELVFARSLVQAAEYATATAPGTVAAHGGELSRRVRRLISPSFKEETMFKKLLVLVPLAALVAVQLVRIEHVAAAPDAAPERSDQNSDSDTSTPDKRADADARNEAPTGDVKRVSFSIDMIEDHENSLAEFGALRDRLPFIVFDSEAILPTIRILARHDLIRKLSSPKLTCKLGQTASMKTGAEIPVGVDKQERDGIGLDVSARELDRQMLVEFTLNATHRQQRIKVDSSILVNDLQSVVIKVGANQGDTKTKVGTPVYVVLTPRIVN